MGEHGCNMKSMRRKKRAYVKAARAESEAETRTRIVEAVVALHEELGPVRTTVKAIAERAGVQRLTVYRHFPDEEHLFAACSARWNERIPLPDLAAIEASDPRRRARELLIALYRYYRAAAPMLEKVLADAPQIPAVRAQLAPFGEYLEKYIAELARGWRGRSSRRLTTLRHAVQFTTWQSLATLTKDDREAAELVMGWCEE